MRLLGLKLSYGVSKYITTHDDANKDLSQTDGLIQKVVHKYNFQQRVEMTCFQESFL